MMRVYVFVEHEKLVSGTVQLRQATGEKVSLDFKLLEAQLSMSWPRIFKMSLHSSESSADI